jgi:hypothetical protein
VDCVSQCLGNALTGIVDVRDHILWYLKDGKRRRWQNGQEKQGRENDRSQETSREVAWWKRSR